MENFKESELISKLKNNDQNAYNIFYKHFKPIIHKHIYYKIHNKSQSDELIQEVFLKCFNAIKSYNPDKSKLQTWILNIATNICIDAIKCPSKHLKFNQKYIYDENQLYQTPDIINKNPEILYLIAEKYDIIQVLINMLPDNEYNVIFKRYLENKSYQEIADSMNQNINWVKIYLYKAKKQLIRLYNKHY